MDNNMDAFRKGYKVLKSNWKCRDKQYTCPGRFKEAVTPVRCVQGMHYCVNLANCFNYYEFDPLNHVVEVIAHGRIDCDDEFKKCCTDDLEIVRELSWNEVLDTVNKGKKNTGFANVGDGNTGFYNLGSNNSGHNNAGSNNTGTYNKGNCNTGTRNMGIANTGNHNIGNFNVGSKNEGNYNVGYHNRGNSNIGCFNIGNFHKGCFMTLHDNNYISLFNKPSEWTLIDFLNSRAYSILVKMPFYTTNWEKYYQESVIIEEDNENMYINQGVLNEDEGFILNKEKIRQSWWEQNLTVAERQCILKLPNFNRDIFKEITSITVRDADLL